VSESIRVLVADDHTVVRKGIRAVLSTEPGIEVVAEAADGAEAVEAVRTLAPDVVLMDLVMPTMSGIDALRQILAEQPGARILVLTSFATDDQVLPAIRAGALGYLLKDSGPEELVRAIHQVHRGESSLHPRVARQVLDELARPAALTSPEPATPLTGRELEVLRLVARGLSNQEIATALVLSEATVRVHVSSILGKLQLASRTQAALYALRQGLASLADEPTQPH
jgi:NarL family two-component system response regulator LiaR